jgi:RNA recognition motif-containing protein
VSERVYVGNLPFKTTDDELKTLFEQYGKVDSANVIRYKGSGRSKGYAFVIMEESDARKAIDELNEKEYEGRVLKVRIAKPRENYPKKSDQRNQSNLKNMRIGID